MRIAFPYATCELEINEMDWAELLEMNAKGLVSNLVVDKESCFFDIQEA